MDVTTYSYILGARFKTVTQYNQAMKKQHIKLHCLLLTIAEKISTTRVCLIILVTNLAMPNVSRATDSWPTVSFIDIRPLSINELAHMLFYDMKINL
jgi:hypothetical protein